MFEDESWNANELWRPFTSNTFAMVKGSKPGDLVRRYLLKSNVGLDNALKNVKMQLKLCELSGTLSYSGLLGACKYREITQ